MSFNLINLCLNDLERYLSIDSKTKGSPLSLEEVQIDWIDSKWSTDYYWFRLYCLFRWFWWRSTPKWRWHSRTVDIKRNNSFSNFYLLTFKSFKSLFHHFYINMIESRLVWRDVGNDTSCWPVATGYCGWQFQSTITFFDIYLRRVQSTPKAIIPKKN